MYLIRVLTAPIEKFWIMAEEYKGDQKYGKMVAAFAASILIILGMLVTLVALMYLTVTYCFEILLIVGVIIWIYWAVWQKMHSTPQTKEAENVITEDLKKLQESAHKGYVPMRTILFQTIKRSASDIMAKTPRALGEIEVFEEKFLIENGIIFYQFQIPKADIKYQCTTEDLQEFKIILQTAFEALWQGGNFPQIALQMKTDSYGNMYDPVVIDRIDDLGNKYLIQTVYTTNKYMDQLRSYELSGEYRQEVIYDPGDDNFL